VRFGKALSCCYTSRIIIAVTFFQQSCWVAELNKAVLFLHLSFSYGSLVLLAVMSCSSSSHAEFMKQSCCYTRQIVAVRLFRSHARYSSVHVMKIKQSCSSSTSSYRRVQAAAPEPWTSWYQLHHDPGARICTQKIHYLCDTRDGEPKRMLGVRLFFIRSAGQERKNMDLGLASTCTRWPQKPPSTVPRENRLLGCTVAMHKICQGVGHDRVRSKGPAMLEGTNDFLGLIRLRDRY
jgi:hypothetical protein